MSRWREGYVGAEPPWRIVNGKTEVPSADYLNHLEARIADLQHALDAEREANAKQRDLLLSAFEGQHFNDEMGDCFGCNANYLSDSRARAATKKRPALVHLGDEVHEEGCMWLEMAAVLGR